MLKQKKRPRYEVSLQLSDKSIMRIYCYDTVYNPDHNIRFMYDVDFNTICCTWETNVISVNSI